MYMNLIALVTAGEATILGMIDKNVDLSNTVNRSGLYLLGNPLFNSTVTTICVLGRINTDTAVANGLDPRGGVFVIFYNGSNIYNVSLVSNSDDNCTNLSSSMHITVMTSDTIYVYIQPFCDTKFKLGPNQWIQFCPLQVNFASKAQNINARYFNASVGFEQNDVDVPDLHDISRRLQGLIDMNSTVNVKEFLNIAIIHRSGTIAVTSNLAVYICTL